MIDLAAGQIRRVLFLLWTTLLILPTLQAQNPAEGDRADVVSLRFAWPADLGIGVSFASRQTREQPDGNSDMRVQGSYRMRVTQHPRGFRIIQSGLETTLFESVPPMPPMVETLYRNLASLSPDQVVSSEAELIGVERLDELAASVRASMTPLPEGAPPEAEAVLGMIDQMLSEEVLFAQIQEVWNAMVGTWVGADFELGVEYALDRGRRAGADIS